MTRWHSPKKAAVALFLAALLTVLLGPLATPVKSQVAAVGFAATLLKALPTIGSIIGNLFKPKANTPSQSSEQSKNVQQMQRESSEGLKALEPFVKKEQILASLVDASGAASGSVAKMNQILATTKPDKPDMDNLSNLWPDVTEALDNIVKSNPDISVFDNDPSEIRAIKNILSADHALKTKIETQLKYNPSSPDEALLTNLRKNLAELEGRFNDLQAAASIELKIVADGLSAIMAVNPATANPQPKQKSTEDAAMQVMKLAFEQPTALQGATAKSKQRLSDSTNTSVAVY